MAKKANKVVPIQQIESLIYLLRGQKVMLDSDLAVLYGVPTKVLNQAVRRNKERFPEDFIFQLSEEELEQLLRSQIVTSNDKTLKKTNENDGFKELLRSQIVTSNENRGGRRSRPYVFTEQGIAMLSSVLRSPRAVQVNIEITRAFVKIRQWLVSSAELSRRLDEMEKNYDDQFKIVFDAIRELTQAEAPLKREIGFHTARQKPTNRLSKALA